MNTYNEFDRVEVLIYDPAKKEYMGTDGWWYSDPKMANCFKSAKAAGKRALKFMQKENFSGRELQIIKSVTHVEEIVTEIVIQPPTVEQFFDISHTPDF